MANTKKNEIEEVNIEVVIKVDNHIHNNTPIKKGEKISVTKSQAEWLKQHNIIEA